MKRIVSENRSTYVVGPLHDPVAGAMSNEVDVPADRAWLRAHPEAKVRERPASEWEKLASGLPDNAVVRAFFLPDGGLIRAIAFRPEQPQTRNGHP